jgi:Na+-driven multidrug efflux pump
MKTLWIGMMAVTILLGTGIVVVVLYAFGKMILSLLFKKCEVKQVLCADGA